MGTGQVDVLLIEARNVPPKKTGAGNVYVRFRIGDGFWNNWSNSNRMPKTGSPKWDFSASLRVKEKNHVRILYFRLMESKFLAKDESIGECTVDLDALPHNEPLDVWLPLNNNDCSSAFGGELHLCVTYYPLGKSYGQRSIPSGPPQKTFLDAMSPDVNVSPPSPRPQTVSLTGSEPMNGVTPATREQTRAEELYTQAMQVLKDGLLSKSSDQLRTASDILAESLKVFRLGKAYAMLAYIFYLFDCPELQSKYLGFAERLDASFPVVSQLRKALVEEACNRKELDAPNDRLSVVVVGASAVDTFHNVHIGQSIFCKIRVGFFEEEKESNPVVLTSEPLVWREFFEVNLTKASERYKFANQYFKIQMFTRTGDASELIAETRPMDLFGFERDSVVDQWLALVPQQEPPSDAVSNWIGPRPPQPMIRVVFNYQMGVVTEDEAAELLYSALYCRDRPMVESLTRKKTLNINVCFKEFPYSSSKDLEPQYSTPLTKAARFGHRRVIRELITLGANVNAQDKDGFTPLMRALQYDRLYNNTRAIKLLLSLGADTELENSKGINCYGYSKSNDLWLFLKALKPTPLYRFVVIICSNCKFVQIPHCTENEEPCLQSDSCTCPIPTHCSFCSLQLSSDSISRWLSSKNEIGSVNNAFLSRLPDALNCCLVQCKCCTSFGFAATESAQGLQLCRVEGDDIICTKHASDETMVYPLKTSGPLWMIAHHWRGCYLPSSSKISPVVLSRQQTLSIGPMLARTPIWTHDPSPPPFQLEKLPSELFQLVLSHLSCEDLAAFECVSRDMRAISRDEVFWKSKFAQDFMTNSGVMTSSLSSSLTSSASSLNTELSWKEIYVEYHLLYGWVRDLLLDETFNFKYFVRICTTNGHVLVDLKLVGKKYIFNLDGEPFSFDNDFSITLEFASMECMISACITAHGQPPEKVIALNASGQLYLPKASSVSLDDLKNHSGKVSLRMPLQETALSRWVNPYLAIMVPGYQSFMQLKDNVGGSVILDLFYYTIESITLEEGACACR